MDAGATGLNVLVLCEPHEIDSILKSVSSADGFPHHPVSSICKHACVFSGDTKLTVDVYWFGDCEYFGFC